MSTTILITILSSEISPKCHYNATFIFSYNDLSLTYSHSAIRRALQIENKVTSNKY
jgi:hypothetical protein